MMTSFQQSIAGVFPGLRFALGLVIGLAVSPLVLGAEATRGERIDETVQVSANEKISIEAMRGEVRIRPGQDNTFRISGTLDERAEGFELESDNGFTRFEVLMPRSMNFRQGRNQAGSQLEITVPAGAEIEFRTVNAALDIADQQGGVSATSVNGDIRAENLSGFAEINTVNGSIESIGNSGRLELKTVNGGISDEGSSGRLELGAVNGRIQTQSSAEEVSVSVVNGDVDAQLSQVRNLEMSSVNGELLIRLSEVDAPRIEGSTVSGRITLQLPADIDARFSLRSNAGGSIVNELTDAEATRASYGPARRLEFTQGEGRGDVELTSVSGRLLLSTD